MSIDKQKIFPCFLAIAADSAVCFIECDLRADRSRNRTLDLRTDTTEECNLRADWSRNLTSLLEILISIDA